MKASSLTTLLCLSPGPPQLINKSLGKHSSLPLPGFWRLLGTPSPAASLQTLSHLYMPTALCLVSVSFPLLRRTPVFGCAAAAAKSLQSCPTLLDPIDGSPPGSPIPGILQDMGSIPDLGRSHMSWSKKLVHHNYQTCALDPRNCNF